MKCKIAHVAYFVSDMEKSLDFYVNGLGFSHSFSIASNEGKPWIEYLKVCDGQFVELFYNGPKQNSAERSYGHLCLEVADIEEAVAELKAKGIPLDSEPMQGKDLNWQAWTKDPDQNPIEIMQIHKDSPQAKA